MKWLKKNLLSIFIILLVFLMAVAYFWRDIIVTVHSGENGVLFKRFDQGTQMKTFDEGTHLIFPWDIVYKYDMRIQKVSDTVHILSEDGLSIEVLFTIHFKPIESKLALLHKYIGPDYIDKVVYHETSSVIRKLLSKYSPTEIYSFDRDAIQIRIYNVLSKELIARYVNCLDLLIEDVNLPKTISDAIELKISHNEMLRTYEYRLQQEDLEVDRKRKEAIGIKEFERISGVSYLKYRGLEVTEKLVNSNNSKIILMGTDSQLPIILNGEEK